nr:MAG TPA: hypothetical protein [Caudoviricetes sp.]
MFDYDAAMADPESHVFINVSQTSENEKENDE